MIVASPGRRPALTSPSIDRDDARLVRLIVAQARHVAHRAVGIVGQHAAAARRFAGGQRACSAGSTLIRSSVGAPAVVRGMPVAIQRRTVSYSALSGWQPLRRRRAASRSEAFRSSRLLSGAAGKHPPAVGLLRQSRRSRTRDRSPTATVESRSDRATCRGRPRRCSRPAVRTGSTSSSKFTSPADDRGGGLGRLGRIRRIGGGRKRQPGTGT